MYKIQPGYSYLFRLVSYIENFVNNVHKYAHYKNTDITFLNLTLYSFTAVLNNNTLGSIICMRKIAASVLSKLFTIGKENCHTTDAPRYRVSGTLYSNAKNIQSIIPEGQKILTTQ